MTYHAFMRDSLPAFTASRIIPMLGISVTLSLVAHKSPDDLAVFSYVLALFAVISALMPMLLATSGNVASSLAENETARGDFFTAGFTVATCIAALSLLLCSGAFLLATNLSSIQNIDITTFKTLSLIYIPAVPLLSINVFLQLFHEASGKSANCSKIKTFATLCGAAILLMFYMYSSAETFKYAAMAYFLVTELAIFVLLINLSQPHKYFSSKQIQITARTLLTQGLPIALGLAGQKLYFYLAVDRLTTVNTELVAQLAIFMSITSIISIPALALSQIHSLHTSRHPARDTEDYRSGLIWIAGFITTISCLLLLGGQTLFSTFGGEIINYTPELYATAVLFLASSAGVGLTLAHLRAQKDTLMPQLIMNALMLGGVLPLLYGLSWHDEQITVLLNLQGAALVIGFVILHRRVVRKYPAKTRSPTHT